MGVVLKRLARDTSKEDHESPREWQQQIPHTHCSGSVTFNHTFAHENEQLSTGFHFNLYPMMSVLAHRLDPSCREWQRLSKKITSQEALSLLASVVIRVRFSKSPVDYAIAAERVWPDRIVFSGTLVAGLKYI